LLGGGLHTEELNEWPESQVVWHVMASSLKPLVRREAEPDDPRPELPRSLVLGTL